MNTNSVFLPRWSTASFGNIADTSPMEMSALGEHLNQCKGLHESIFALQCAVQSIESFVAARFVTSVVGVALLIGVGVLVS